MAERDDSTERPPSPTDIATAGLASAAAVVERMLDFGRAAASGIRLPLPINSEHILNPFAPRADEGEDEGEAADPTERARQARRFRADAERLVEMYAEWTRLLVDGAASIAEQAAGITPVDGATDGGPGVLVLGPASAGATATTTAWVHVLDGPSAQPAALHATALVAHDGGQVSGSALACTPACLDTSVPRSSSEVRVTAAVPAGTAPGSYHGHLLAAGLPEIVLPVRLEVVA